MSIKVNNVDITSIKVNTVAISSVKVNDVEQLAPPPKVATPTVTVQRDCYNSGFFETCDISLNIKNNDSSQGTIMYGGTTPPSTNGGTVNSGATKSIMIGSMTNNNWKGYDYYYVYIIVSGKTDSDLVTRAVP